MLVNAPLTLELIDAHPSGRGTARVRYSRQSQLIRWAAFHHRVWSAGPDGSAPAAWTAVATATRVLLGPPRSHCDEPVAGGLGADLHGVRSAWPPSAEMTEAMSQRHRSACGDAQPMTQNHELDLDVTSSASRPPARSAIALTTGGALLLTLALVGVALDILRPLLFVIHLLGVLALFGGLITQIRRPDKVVNRLMRDGAVTAIAAALLLAAAILADGGSLDPVKIAIKVSIGVTVLGLVMRNRRKESIASGLWAFLLLLWVVNVCVALLW